MTSGLDRLRDALPPGARDARKADRGLKRQRRGRAEKRAAELEAEARRQSNSFSSGHVGGGGI